MNMKIDFLPVKRTVSSAINNIRKTLKPFALNSQRDTFEAFKPIEYRKCFSLADVHIFSALYFPKTFLDIRKVSTGNEILQTMCNLHNKTKGKVSFPSIIETYRKKDSKFVGDYADDIVRLNATYEGLRSTLIHEIGHYNHEKVCEDYLKMGKKSELIADGISDFSIYNEFNENKPALKLIKKHLGGYATSSACEFVACTFTAVMNGRKLPGEIWELYNKYGGPLAAELKLMFGK